MDDSKKGEIKHIFKTFVFIHSRKHMETGGIFVCKTKQVALVGAKPMDQHGNLFHIYFMKI